ncbi:MAG: S8 family serine peptidase, partial [Faecousia sp.]
MKGKRLLTLLLALCLAITLVTPAFATQAGEDSVIANTKPEQTSQPNTSASGNGHIVSGMDAVSGLLNLRDNPITVSEVQSKPGIWEITPGNAPEIGLFQTKAPACLKDLVAAAEDYTPDQVVRAFVVMEESPLAETYTSIASVSASDEEKLMAEQDKVIDTIEKYVLSGGELNVRYQFTYLTNAFTVETEFSNLAKIACVSGVKSVFIAPSYSPCETVANPNTAASGAMTGVHDVWEDLGFTGQGMKIAIIDTGLDLDHPSFSALDSELVAEYDSYLDRDDIAAVLQDLNAYDRRPTITDKTLYRSTKVPYAFNYCDNSLLADHSADTEGDHGTHVAGIAAANKTDGTSVVGMAPDAQIIVMKVFGANGGAYTDDIVAALEDAMTLGCDVVNASLGSPAGFTDSGRDEVDAIYDRLANQNIIATISAGNEGTSSYKNMWGTDLNRTDNPENGTIGSPSLYHNAFSIASAENSEVMTPFFTLADGTRVFYNPSLDYMYGRVPGMETLAGVTLEYVFIDGFGGDPDEFYDEDGNSLVDGKVAVVFRGGKVNFSVKISNAENAGAVACIIANNIADDIYDFYMSTGLEDGSYPRIPTCLITLDDASVMAAAETATLTASAEQAPRVCEGGQMSSFSSWGVSSDLRLVPDITGIGGNVYSCYDGGEYGLMSGTSMASPQLAGISALVMQYLYSKYPDAANDGTIREMAIALLMSTADPVISTDSFVEASPRQQGAGLVNAAEAVQSGAYLTVNGGRPKAELGDSLIGDYSFSFEIHNFGDSAQTYSLNASLLTEDFVDYGVGIYFMAGYDAELNGTVSFDQESVTVPAGETATVTVSISLSEDDKEMFDTYWANGGFVEGYVYLENADEQGVDLNLPFLGFYGDWTKAPIFDTANWYDDSFWGVGSGWPKGDEFYHVLWTDLAGTSWVLGFNPYAGAYTDDETGHIVYDPDNNSISPNGDGVIDGLDDIYLSLLRNAKTMTITFTDAATGAVIHEESFLNNSKTMYMSSYGQVVPWLYSWYGNGMDFSGLANNTKVWMTVEATVDYGDGGEHSISFPFTIDTEVPTLESVTPFEYEGYHFIEVVVSDNVNVGGIFLMNRAGTQIYGADYCYVPNDDGTYSAYFNVDELGTELMIVAGDYAGNEGYYNITYTEAGDNLPTMPTDQLYAYRIMDNAIYSDHMYGWISMNFPTEGENAEISVWSDDYMEYAAINAAEYAGGKIFAVDAVYNLVVMDPGLWNRTTICNLGVNVLDMTFDDSTDTMYLLVKDGYYTSLQTLDLMTGELTVEKSYGYFGDAPVAITDDDNGTLYALKYYNSGLYILDKANDYAMTPIQDAEGNNLTILDSNGAYTRPQYAQSIAYVDGTIYWAYISLTHSELIAVDLETLEYAGYAYSAWAYDSSDNLINYSPYTELVGLLTLTETNWKIPEGSVLNGLSMDSDYLVLTPGQSETLHVYASPWNYDLSGQIWSSSDPDVATVVDGKVTAVSEGTATITVSVGDVEAYCDVIVVDTNTTFNAYNYYSGDDYSGYMIQVDTGLMDYYLTDKSPVDFLAGDYNGHDGYFYGYSEGGQFWRYDPETGDAERLGNPVGVVPTDMAYDYSTGLMYAINLDFNAGVSSLCVVNLNTGRLEEVYSLPGVYMMTLAADLDGTLYSVTADGMLISLVYLYDEDFDEYYWSPEPLMFDLGYVQYMQSMCYDYAHDVLLWAYCEAGSIYWIDVHAGYVISLGDPTSSGAFEFVGMYTVPADIPELEEVPVIEVEANDMVMLTGSTKFADAIVRPFNATCQSISWTSDDESIVRVNADGSLTAVAEGTATISGVLTDSVSGKTFDVSFSVMVIEGADDIYGMLMMDLSTYGGNCWLRLYAVDPSVTDVIGYTSYVIYAEEYYDGKLYAYGYDDTDWESNWQFFVIDPTTFRILEQHDLGYGFPFVYDMTYDYTTSTMYALAGPNTSSDFYAVDMETGELILIAQTEQFFMSLTASPDGTLYAMEKSLEEGDWWSGVTISDAQMYTIDPATGSVEWFMDTGIQCNMLASMAYDYDTGYIYWTALGQGSTYTGGLCLIDPETRVAYNLGTIGTAGAQVDGLYIISENFPEEHEPSLLRVLLDSTRAAVNVGGSVELHATVLPLAVDADIVWTSSDESVATVDENGVVTGVSQGSAIITASVTYNGVTKIATCQIGVIDEDAAFLTWNRTDMGWSAINRVDYTVVTNLTEGEDTEVTAIASVCDAVYGYDINGQFFRLNTTDYSRTPIGSSIARPAIEEFITDNDLEEAYGADEFVFRVRDMAFDVANHRMLVLGAVMLYDADYDDYNEFTGSCALYTVDLETGALEKLYTFMDMSYVYGLTVDEDGNVFFYSTFMDFIYKLDMTTGLFAQVISLQSQMLYGNSGIDSHYTLFYDALTGMIYMEDAYYFSDAYLMLSIDPATGTLKILSEIGEPEYDADYDDYFYNAFSGITFVDPSHSWGEWVVTTDPTCTEKGEETRTCSICGETEKRDVDALGHDYDAVVTDPTCTEKGY